MLDSDISTADALRHLSFDEEPSGRALDRRRFLHLVGMGVGAGVVAGGSGSLLDHALGRHIEHRVRRRVGETDRLPGQPDLDGVPRSEPGGT